MRIFSIFFILFFVKIAVAQVKITGRVVLASDGEAAIGATVSLKGSTIGTTTDFDGNFKLEVPDRTAILVFSYTGFISQEIAVGNQTELNVRLEENISQLNEVVVTGYGSQKRSSISGSVSTVTAAEIAERPILRVEQALQGRTAGVQVAQNSGSPGSALTVRVRGIGSFGNSDPLYIVDGVPVDGLDFLNPNDIETLNILKDAASAAIYGTRGANGVVLITTKGGKRNQDGKISYESYYGIQRAARFVDLMDAREYATLQNEAYVAAGKTPLPEFAHPEFLGKGTDWQEAIFEAAPIASHQLTLTGGGERSSYAISGNYFSQDGIVGGKKANFQRATVRFNSSHDLKKWLTVGNNLAFTWLERQGLLENTQYNSPIIRALNMDPITPIRKRDGTFAYSNYSGTDIANPVNAIQNTYNTWRSNRLVGSVFGELKLMEGLTFRSAFSLDATFAVQRGFIPKFDLSNIPTLSEAPAAEKSLINTVSIGNNNWRNWQLENVLTYHKKMGDDHDLTLIAGTTALANRYDANGGANTNLPSNKWEDAYISNTIDPIESQSIYQWATESSLFSYFAKANYDLKNTYLFCATFRADGSSKFGKNNRFGYFPSFSAGWIASHEDFWNWKTVNFFKLRASWGRNGNDRIGDYGYSTIVYNGQNYVFGPSENITNGAVALTAANPDLRWETSIQSNIGLDAEMFDGRIGLTADFYVKNTSDMLFAAPIPLVAGTAPPVQNVASARNQGLELALNYRNFDHPIKFSLGGNIAFVKSEVVSLGRGGEPVLAGYVQFANGYSSILNVGLPIAAFYGFQTDGIFQNQAEIEKHAFQSNQTAPGDIRFKDLDGNGIIDENDRTLIGNPTPRFAYGFNADFQWRGLELNLFFQGTHGNDIFVNTTRYDFNYVNRPASALRRWTGEGTSNTEPRVSLSDPNQNARVSNRFVEDGSYLRLKTMQIGYNLPKNWLKKVHFEKMKIYFTGQNLLTFTKYSGLDPEIGAVGGSLELGIDRGFYPQARTVLAGVSLTF